MAIFTYTNATFVGAAARLVQGVLEFETLLAPCTKHGKRLVVEISFTGPGRNALPEATAVLSGCCSSYLYAVAARIHTMSGRADPPDSGGGEVC